MLDPRSEAYRLAGMDPGGRSTDNAALVLALLYVGEQVQRIADRDADPEPVAEKRVRMITGGTVELDGKRFDLLAGDELVVPGLMVRIT